MNKLRSSAEIRYHGSPMALGLEWVVVFQIKEPRNRSSGWTTRVRRREPMNRPPGEIQLTMREAKARLWM